MIEVEKLLANPEAVISEICGVNLVDLETTMAQHPALFAFGCAMAEQAKVAEIRSKWAVDQAYSRAYIALMEDKTIKRTVDQTKAEVDQNPQYIKAVEAHQNAQHYHGIWKALLQSLEHRRDMLVQISARQRAERETYR